MHKVGICGNGFVGVSVSTGFEMLIPDEVDVRVYDKYQETESLDSVVQNSDIIYICVPTPTDFSTQKCDTSIVEGCCKQINDLATTRKIIIIKSTVPPGTTDKMQQAFPNHTFMFIPEFLREKTFIEDTINQDRIIFGLADGVTKTQIKKVYYLYNDFVDEQAKLSCGAGTIYPTSAKVAETCKYVGNCFLATKVAFFNEIYQICQAAGIKYDDVKELVSLDKRIGNSHMDVPGPDGKFCFSGKCFPKDLNSLIFFAKSIGVDPLVLDSIWTKNTLLREPDWEDIPGATTTNLNFKKD